MGLITRTDEEFGLGAVDNATDLPRALGVITRMLGVGANTVDNAVVDGTLITNPL